MKCVIDVTFHRTNVSVCLYQVGNELVVLSCKLLKRCEANKLCHNPFILAVIKVAKSSMFIFLRSDSVRSECHAMQDTPRRGDTRSMPLCHPKCSRFYEPPGHVVRPRLVGHADHSQMARSRWLVRRVYPALPFRRLCGGARQRTHVGSRYPRRRRSRPCVPSTPLPSHHVRGHAATPPAHRAPRVHAPSRRSPPIYLPLATRRAAPPSAASSERRSK